MKLGRESWERFALVALAVGAYATSLTVPFLQWDDPYYVTQSFKTSVRGWPGFVNVWTLNDVLNDHALEYFPLRDTVYWVVYGLFGPSPIPFHVVSVVAHAACVLLMFGLALRFGFARHVAFWAAALFAAHPVHVESVTWVSGLKDPMCLALMLGSLHQYLSYREDFRPWRYAAFLGLLVCSLLVKSLGLVTPLLVLMVELTIAPRAKWRLIARRLVGPFAIAGLFAAHYVAVGQYLKLIQPPHGGSWFNHAFLAGWALVRYVQQALVPATFSLIYGFQPVAGLADWRLPLIVLTVAGAAVGMALTWRREPRAALLIGWFFACLLPVSNIVPFPAVMADRYLYASTVASCLGTAWLASRLPGRGLALVLGAMVTVFALVTLGRGVVWQQEINLWAEAANRPESAVDPEAAVAISKYYGLIEDPQQALAVLPAILQHPGYERMKRAEKCWVLSRAARLESAVGNPERARWYALRAAELCSAAAEIWEVVMAVSWRHDPKGAADAARRIARLAPSPTNELLYAAALASAGERSALDRIHDLVVGDPEALCVPFMSWLERNPVAEPAPLQPAIQTCAAVHTDGGITQ